MAYRNFGRTGVKVSPLTLGTMNFGARANADHDDAIRVIHRALDAGINVVDTADVYSQGESEEIVGKALAGGRRDDVFLATKLQGNFGQGINTRGLSRRWVHQAVDASLRRLGTDWIDLYQMHRPEPDTDLDETLGALSDLVHQGKIRYIGSSTFEPSQLVEAQWVSERRGRERVVSEQPPYSILARAAEREVLPVARRHGLAVLPWSPLAGGYLSGRFRRDAEARQSDRAATHPARHDLSLPENERKLQATYALQDLADEAGYSLVHLAIAFVLQHPAVTSVIIGPRTLRQLEEQLDAADLRLPGDVLDRIDQIVAPGTTINPADGGYIPPSLTDASTRRRNP